MGLRQCAARIRLARKYAVSHRAPDLLPQNTYASISTSQTNEQNTTPNDLENQYPRIRVVIFIDRVEIFIDRVVNLLDVTGLIRDILGIDWCSGSAPRGFVWRVSMRCRVAPPPSSSRTPTEGSSLLARQRASAIGYEPRMARNLDGISRILR